MVVVVVLRGAVVVVVGATVVVVVVGATVVVVVVGATVVVVVAPTVVVVVDGLVVVVVGATVVVVVVGATVVVVVGATVVVVVGATVVVVAGAVVDVVAAAVVDVTPPVSTTCAAVGGVMHAVAGCGGWQMCPPLAATSGVTVPAGNAGPVAPIWAGPGLFEASKPVSKQFAAPTPCAPPNVIGMSALTVTDVTPMRPMFA